ncbi:MAG: FKBP-type peptidyl-prolyl cis-trans isomerase [Bacteroidales bacterium]|nr:FKBP-type peptidyl-prolyl cis-trans isomerase [Bacteroidales bacterium]
MKINPFLILLSFCCFISCSKGYNEDFAVGRDEKSNEADQRNKQLQKSLENANKIINIKETENILSYIDRRKWNMQHKDGVYLQIVREGVGDFIQSGDIVTMQYDCFLLNGTKINDSSDNVITFSAKGDTKVPFGVISAVKYMKNNTSARLIIPSELAFELTDEGEKQSSNNTLIYIIDIKDVQKAK